MSSTGRSGIGSEPDGGLRTGDDGFLWCTCTDGRRGGSAIDFGSADCSPGGAAQQHCELNCPDGLESFECVEVDGSPDAGPSDAGPPE
jgi:hypothetical protein